MLAKRQPMALASDISIGVVNETRGRASDCYTAESIRFKEIGQQCHPPMAVAHLGLESWRR